MARRRKVCPETAEGTPTNLSPADFLDFERDNTVFSRVGANGFVGLFTITGGRGEAERVGGVQVTEGFFQALQIQPAVGRAFLREEDQPGTPRVAILSDGFWRRRYGADTAVVGSTITLNAQPVTVVGVLPPTFRHLEINPERPADVFVLFRFNPAEANRGGHFIHGVGRLEDGVTVTQARAEMEAIAARLEEQHPTDNTNQGVVVEPLLESIVGESRPVLLLLSAAVGFVLLVACANVANLLLARGTGRLKSWHFAPPLARIVGA